MKRRTNWTILLLLVIALSGSPARAEFMNVISHEYSIEGSVSFGPMWPGSGEARFVTYQETSSSPVSRTVDWTHPAVPYNGFAYLETTADGGLTDTGAWIHTLGLAIDSDSGETYAQGLTSASITFAPLVTSFVATINGLNASWSDTEATPGAVELFDLTSHVSLLPPYDDPYWHSGGLFEPIPMSLDLSHVYKMSIDFAVPPSGTPYEFSLGLNHQPVPEPATLLLLASGLVGLGGVVWWRHRRG